MSLLLELYLSQAKSWPAAGRHILAQYDNETIVVYQAYKAPIGRFAAEHGYFGGEFSLSRMSWIKPNFLWMMYRCGWGTKADQEVVLAIRLKRSGFDQILNLAVHSSFVPKIYTSEADWKTSLAQSDVRLQWDPDHHPSGAKLERRAIQLGLRGDVLAQYAQKWIVSIEDISEFVDEQHQHVANNRYDVLLTPRETIYPISDAETSSKLGLSKNTS